MSEDDSIILDRRSLVKKKRSPGKLGPRFSLSKRHTQIDPSKLNAQSIHKKKEAVWLLLSLTLWVKVTFFYYKRVSQSFFVDQFYFITDDQLCIMFPWEESHTGQEKQSPAILATEKGSPILQAGETAAETDPHSGIFKRQTPRAPGLAIILPRFAQALS